MKHHEHTLQTACVRWFRYQYPKYEIFAVPNGGSRDNKKEAKRLKDEGVLSGVSDLIIFSEKKVLLVEMKTPTGRQTQSQKAFQQKIEKLGYLYFICRSVEEFMNICESNLK